jgi:hypothetical protein
VSDFLYNLARRSLGSVESVQPRLPSLFEKAQPAAGSLLAPGFIVSEKDREPSADIPVELDSETPPARGPVHSSAPEFTPPRPRDTDFSMQEHTPLPALEPAAPPPAAPHSPVISQVPGALSSAPQLPQVDRPARPATGVKPAAAVDAASASHFRGAEPQSKSTVEPPARPAETKPRVPIAPATVKPQRKERGAKDFASAELPASLRRLIESRSAYKLPATASLPAAPSEPTIQVTIGRIEVRAAQHPAPAPTRQAGSPNATLEEYLRSRSQRGRR